jgi:hypothetical protein
MTSAERLLIVLLLGALAAPPAPAQGVQDGQGNRDADGTRIADERIARARIHVVADRCRQQVDPDEIVICGARDPDRYRLPIRDERSETSLYDRANGDAPRASLDPPSSAACGIFQGDRRCSKAEAALFGYGRGRDPLTLGARIIDQLGDPD